MPSGTFTRALARRPRPAPRTALAWPLATALALALAGCGGAPSATAPQAGDPARSAARTGANAGGFAIVAEFSAKDTVAAERDRRIVRWQDTPCGMSPVVKTATMLLDDPVLQPDFIVEFAPDGRVLRTWGKPFNARIGVLRGGRVSFAQWDGDRERLYWTDTAGRIAPGDAAADARPRIDDTAPIACPPLALFGDSEFLGCFETADAASGTRHRIAFEAACT